MTRPYPSNPVQAHNRRVRSLGYLYDVPPVARRPNLTYPPPAGYERIVADMASRRRLPSRPKTHRLGWHDFPWLTSAAIAANLPK